jgi:enoyl-[acyl-carrier protein] reductase I
VGNMLAGKTGLVFGVANHRSVAWAVAQALAREGARLAFSYIDRVERQVSELTNTIPGSVLIPADVTDDAQMDGVFKRVDKEFGSLDILIHSVGFAKKEELAGRFVDTSRDGWRIALESSAFSLPDMARRAEHLMERNGGGSIVTFTYLGGERVVPNYNVMGVAKAALDCCVRYLAADLGPRNIRVNAISAGPMRTLASRGIQDFTLMEKHAEERSPLQRNIDQSEVADATLFLCSPLGKAITGQVIHVDAGYSVMGM